jgi:ribosomal protein L39E
MDTSGMAELLYNLLECQFEPSPGIADGQNKTLSRMLKNKNYFKVFTSLSQRNRTTPLWIMLATNHVDYDPWFHVDIDVGGDIGPGRAPAVRDSQETLGSETRFKFEAQ